MTLLYHHDLFLEHIPEVPHVECPDRLVAIRREFEARELWTPLGPEDFGPVSDGQISLAHAPAMMARTNATCQRGGGQLDPDTPVTERSLDAAKLAAGCGVAAVDAVITAKAKNAFCLVRPPGHHATPTRAMGFCLINNIAVAALHALQRHGLSRVLIVDFDVHHGNGTQDIFYEDERVFFLSAHRFPFYPGSGSASETGTGPGLGYTINLPVRFGVTPGQYRDLFFSALDKAVQRAKPELVLISAGFDAHRLDPIGSLGLDHEDFIALTDHVLDIADAHAAGRVVSMLEGGYNVDILAELAADHFETLLKKTPGPR